MLRYCLVLDDVELGQGQQKGSYSRNLNVLQAFRLALIQVHQKVSSIRNLSSRFHSPCTSPSSYTLFFVSTMFSQLNVCVHYLLFKFILKSRYSTLDQKSKSKIVYTRLFLSYYPCFQIPQLTSFPSTTRQVLLPAGIVFESKDSEAKLLDLNPSFALCWLHDFCV